MRDGWRELSVGDVIDVHYGKDHKSLSDGHVPAYGSAGIMRYVEKPLSETPSILIPRKGTLNNVMYSMVPFWTVDTMFWCTIKNANSVDLKYLYYWLKRIDFSSLNVGSAVPSTTVPTINALKISLPPIETQKKIAGVLGALDDKIELNRKMNENLEAQAQALFKSWFVDFTPFGGKMPHSWRKGKLGEMISVCYGKDHKKLEDGPIPVYGSGGVMRYASSALCEKEAVLIPRKGTLNNIMYVNWPFWSVDTMFYATAKIDYILKYVYHYLRRQNMESYNTGSAVPSMTTDILNKMELVLPDKKNLKAFDDVVGAMFSKLHENERESRKLAEVRDALLPKLMRGEVEV